MCKVFIFMAQLDSLIVFPLLWSLLFVLIIYYNIAIKKLIPSFFGVKKFREKKLGSPDFYSFKSSLKFMQSYNAFQRGCNLIGRVYALQA
jgi:hypothetical protein